MNNVAALTKTQRIRLLNDTFARRLSAARSC